MTNCEECGKVLGILEGYRHPVMGKKHLLCSNCFDSVSESVEKWKDFVNANSFVGNSSKNSLENQLKKIFTNVHRRYKGNEKYIQTSIGKNTYI